MQLRKLSRTVLEVSTAFCTGAFTVTATTLNAALIPVPPAMPLKSPGVQAIAPATPVPTSVSSSPGPLGPTALLKYPVPLIPTLFIWFIGVGVKVLVLPVPPPLPSSQVTSVTVVVVTVMVIGGATPPVCPPTVYVVSGVCMLTDPPLFTAVFCPKGVCWLPPLKVPVPVVPVLLAVLKKPKSSGDFEPWPKNQNHTKMISPSTTRAPTMIKISLRFIVAMPTARSRQPPARSCQKV